MQQSHPAIAAGNKSPRGRETRSLHDKDWQRDAKQRIIQFLVERRFPDEISPKKLTSPTLKELLNILHFLLRIVDSARCPRELSTDSESIEYVLHFLKAVRYPAPPTKGVLQSASSPVYLPIILGVLSWLVTYATYHSNYSVQPRPRCSVRTVWAGTSAL